MSRPGKPVEQKRRAGNPGKRPLPPPGDGIQLARIEGVAEPSRPLGEPGLRTRRRTWREAGAWLAPSDEDAVLLYAEAVDDYVQLRESIHRRGFDDETMWRSRKQLIDLARQVHQLAGSLGLSPSARAQLGVAEVPVSGHLEHLMERGPGTAPTIKIEDE